MLKLLQPPARNFRRAGWPSFLGLARWGRVSGRRRSRPARMANPWPGRGHRLPNANDPRRSTYRTRRSGAVGEIPGTCAIPWPPRCRRNRGTQSFRGGSFSRPPTGPGRSRGCLFCSCCRVCCGRAGRIAVPGDTVPPSRLVRCVRVAQPVQQGGPFGMGQVLNFS